MRILFAGDEHGYSEYAIKETAKLAMNTWADVTLLGVHAMHSAKDSAKTTPIPHGNLPVSEALRGYRDLFLNSWIKEESPYELQDGNYEWIQLNNGRWEEARGLPRAQKRISEFGCGWAIHLLRFCPRPSVMQPISLCLDAPRETIAFGPNPGLSPKKL